MNTIAFIVLTVICIVYCAGAIGFGLFCRSVKVGLLWPVWVLFL